MKKRFANHRSFAILTAAVIFLFTGCTRENNAHTNMSKSAENTVSSQNIEDSQEDTSLTWAEESQIPLPKTANSSIPISGDYYFQWESYLVEMTANDSEPLFVTIFDGDRSIQPDFHEIRTELTVTDGDDTNRYDIHFILWEYNGKAGCREVASVDGGPIWNVSCNSDGNIVNLFLYGYRGYIHFYSYYPDTGEITEAPIERLPLPDNYAVGEINYSPDETKVILHCSSALNYSGAERLYYANLTANTITDVTENLIMEDFYADVLSTVWVDNDTLLIYAFRSEDNSCAAWTYSLSTGSMAQTLSPVQKYKEDSASGIIFFHDLLALYVQQYGDKTSVLNLVTGEQCEIVDFTYAPYNTYVVSSQCLYYVVEGIDSCLLRALSLKEAAFTHSWYFPEKPESPSSFEWLDDEHIILNDTLYIF